MLDEGPESQVVACSLAATAAAQTGRDWAALLARALIARTRDVDGLRVELQSLPGVRGELERLVAVERDCCPFMAIDIRMHDAAIVLTVTAPAAAAAILDEVFAANPR